MPETLKILSRELISPETRIATLPDGIRLECGEHLSKVQVAYRTWGRLNDRQDNVVLICHALTGSADADRWWGQMFGQGRAFDPQRDFIVCINLLGSCYGTTGPRSINPLTGRIYGADFPEITLRDMVEVQWALLHQLKVRGIQLAIGGSLGGMLVLEWALMFPQMVRTVVSIAASGRHSAWCIGLSEAQRQAIYADPRWANGDYDAETPPHSGLAAARMMAMCTYRSRGSFENRFSRQRQNDGNHFSIESYLHHQGQKLGDRFEAASYVVLTKAMDSHDVARGRGEYFNVLNGIQQPTLVVSYKSDVLYPTDEQEELSAALPHAELVLSSSPHGHDAFLIDVGDLAEFVGDFRQRFRSS